MPRTPPTARFTVPVTDKSEPVTVTDSESNFDSDRHGTKTESCQSRFHCIPQIKLNLNSKGLSHSHGTPARPRERPCGGPRQNLRSKGLEKMKQPKELRLQVVRCKSPGTVIVTARDSASAVTGTVNLNRDGSLFQQPPTLLKQSRGP